MKSYRPIFFIFAIFLNVSCQEDPDATRLVLRINDHKVSCTGYEGQTECYLVQRGKKRGTDEWTYFYEQIEGFTYTPGTIYELVVRKEELDTDYIDAPNVKYTLIRVLSPS